MIMGDKIESESNGLEPKFLNFEKKEEKKNFFGRMTFNNYAKRENKLVGSRIIWYLNNSKDISFQVSSSPNISIGMRVSGDEGEVTFNFWLFLSFYITFSGIFPEWIYPREYNSFSDKENINSHFDSENKNLKGRDRTRDKGWIRSATRNLSLSFHNYCMWWEVWTGRDNKLSQSKFRYGNIDFVKLLKGSSKFDSELIETVKTYIQMPEGKYLCHVDTVLCKRIYPRWWSSSWLRFEFKFGYLDENVWVDTPVVMWGKGSESYNCGMDGTYSISIGAATNFKDAEKLALESLIRSREKTGEVDFSGIKHTENGYIMRNLIGEF